MKRVIILFFIFMPFLGANASAPNNLQSLFIYQFTKLIDWPAETKTGMFRIGVIGSFEAYKELMDVTMGRKVGRQNIEVMNLMNIDQLTLTDFHMLVVCEKYCSPQKLNEINARLKDQNTLIIAHEVNYAGDYADIGFKTDEERIDYIYNQELMHMKGLKCSRDFLKLGQNKM